MESEVGQKGIRVSFHTYDFLGYFVPGALFFSIVIIFEYYFHKIFNTQSFLPLYYFLEGVKEYFLGSGSHWSLELIIIVLFIIICYSLGHSIASFSAFFIDRVLVGSALKYPYKVLLKISDARGEQQIALRNHLVIFVILFNAFLIYTIIFYLPSWVYFFIFFFLMVYFIKILFSYSRSSKRRFIWLINLTHRIIKLFTDLLQTYLGIYEPFPDNFIDKFKETYKNVFKSDIETDGVNIYWFTRNYVSEKSPIFNGLLNNWFNLYSFARNLSTSIYFSYIYIILVSNVNIFVGNNYYQSCICKFYSNSFEVVGYKIAIIFLFILSIVMILRYYYLYYTYYNKYLYRTFYYLARK